MSYFKLTSLVLLATTFLSTPYVQASNTTGDLDPQAPEALPICLSRGDEQKGQPHFDLGDLSKLPQEVIKHKILNRVSFDEGRGILYSSKSIYRFLTGYDTPAQGVENKPIDKERGPMPPPLNSPRLYPQISFLRLISNTRSKQSQAHCGMSFWKRPLTSQKVSGLI